MTGGPKKSAMGADTETEMPHNVAAQHNNSTNYSLRKSPLC